MVLVKTQNLYLCTGLDVHSTDTFVHVLCVPKSKFITRQKNQKGKQIFSRTKALQKGMIVKNICEFMIDVATA